MKKVAVIGGGSWGLSISTLLKYNGMSVSIWEYNEDNVKEILETRYNKRLLPDVRIDESIQISSNLSEVILEGTELIMLAVPSHTVRIVTKQVAQHLGKIKGTLRGIVNLSKGVEQETLMRLSEVIKSELTGEFHHLVATLSGPSHAEEVALNIPTAVVLAGSDEDVLLDIQTLLSNEYFRVYTSDDVIGVELGGAIKNIIAIASGLVSGLGLGDNTQGALLTRGLAEIRRLGVKMGAKPQTINGLSGIGDLITTALSQHSRNRYVGYKLGKGSKLDDILEGMAMVAEGVITTKSIYHLKNKLGVDMPITDEIYQVLFDEKPPEKAIVDLMTRDLKGED
ncbi:MAG: NAD(P)H-dependent glycerol-3-phosphate dehydrogenase [Candidatus Cloacimonadia bacterium]|jgi:glycerol-3-phosphate dehydrogenase (NAD(P)+)